MFGCIANSGSGKLEEQTKIKEKSPAPGGVNPRDAALLVVLWYPLEQKALSASAAVMLPLLGVALLCHAPEEVLFLSSSEGVSVFTHESPRRNSYMDVLDTVIALLGLLATVIIGTARITWVIAKEIFRNTHDAKHYSKK